MPFSDATRKALSESVLRRVLTEQGKTPDEIAHIVDKTEWILDPRWRSYVNPVIDLPPSEFTPHPVPRDAAMDDETLSNADDCQSVATNT